MEPLTVSMQAAATSGLSRATLYWMIDRSELDTIKVGIGLNSFKASWMRQPRPATYDSP